jgi:hypothetical protein
MTLPLFLRAKPKTDSSVDPDLAGCHAHNGYSYGHGAWIFGAGALACAWFGWAAWFCRNECLALRGFRLLGHHEEEAQSLLIGAIGCCLAQLLLGLLAVGLGRAAQRRSRAQVRGEWLGTAAQWLGMLVLVLLVVRL